MIGKFKGERVEFTKGDYKGVKGTFKTMTGFTDGYGAVCEIEVDNVGSREFTSDFFRFESGDIQNKWDFDGIESDEMDF